MIKPEQSRAGRGLLGWTQQDLADATGLSKTSIFNFEKGEIDPRGVTQNLLAKAFDKAEIEFPDEFTVRRKREYVQILKGPDAIRKLWDDVYNSLKDCGGEVLISNVDETRALKSQPEILKRHLSRIKKYNIRERLLICEGDMNLLMPRECYRWISKELFNAGVSSYVYANKVALILWGSSIVTLIYSHDAYQAEKKRFEFLWEKAMVLPKKIQNK
jgi:transcriptional regulator with XRE-family HTH domain